MRASRDEPRPFGLLGALGLSVVIHALLALLTLWIPVVTQRPALAEEQEDRITFSFIEPERLDETVEDGAPPEPSVPLPPVEPRVDDPVPDPIDAEEEPLPDDMPEQQETIEPEPVEQNPARSAAEDPAPQVTPWRDLERPEASSPAEPAPRQRDMQQALQDFQRAIRSSRAAPAERSPPAPPSSNVFVPEMPGRTAAGFGVGNLVFESRDYDWSDYARQIYYVILRAWYNRLWMTTDDFEKWAHENRQWLLSHQTQIRFVIEKNGQVTGIVQEAPSGCLPLDDSALEALAEVILPPLPADFPRDREVVHAVFLARGGIREMRGALRFYKSIGLF